MVETLGKWAPLLIAAGYFLFLVATYVKVVNQLKLSAIAEPIVEPKTAELWWIGLSSLPSPVLLSEQ